MFFKNGFDRENLKSIKSIVSLNTRGYVSNLASIMFIRLPFAHSLFVETTSALQISNPMSTCCSHGLLGKASPIPCIQWDNALLQRKPWLLGHLQPTALHMESWNVGGVMQASFRLLHKNTKFLVSELIFQTLAAQNRESRIARFPESQAWNRQKFHNEKQT